MLSKKLLFSISTILLLLLISTAEADNETATPESSPAPNISTSAEPTLETPPSESPQSIDTYNQCNPDNLIMCKNESTCQSNGGKWCDSKCLYECAYQPQNNQYPSSDQPNEYYSYPTQYSNQPSKSYPYQTQQYPTKTSKTQPTNTEDNKVDSFGLLSSVLQLEGLKINLDKLHISVKKLIKYHNSKGNSEYSNKWEIILSDIASVIKTMDISTSFVRSKLSDLTKDDLSKFKSELKKMADSIQSIIKKTDEIKLARSVATKTTEPKPSITTSTFPSPSTSPNSTQIPSPTPEVNISPTPEPVDSTFNPMIFRTKPGTYNWYNWDSTLRGQANYSQYNITAVEYYFKKLSDGSYYSPRGAVNTNERIYWSPNETLYNRSDDVPYWKSRSFYMQVFLPSFTPGETYEFAARAIKQDGTKTQWYTAQYRYEDIPQKYALLKTPVQGQQFKVGDKINITGQCLGDVPWYKCSAENPECDSSTWSVFLKQMNPDGTWREGSWNTITTKKVNNSNGKCDFQWPIQMLQDCVLVVETTSRGTTRGYNCTTATGPRLTQLMLSIYPSCMGSNAADRQAACIREQRDIINITLSP